MFCESAGFSCLNRTQKEIEEARAVDVAQLAMALDAALKKAEPGVEQALIVRVGAAAK